MRTQMSHENPRAGEGCALGDLEELQEAAGSQWLQATVSLFLKVSPFLSWQLPIFSLLCLPRIPAWTSSVGPCPSVNL